MFEVTRFFQGSKFFFLRTVAIPRFSRHVTNLEPKEKPIIVIFLDFKFTLSLDIRSTLFF